MGIIVQQIRTRFEDYRVVRFGAGFGIIDIASEMVYTGYDPEDYYTCFGFRAQTTLSSGTHVDGNITPYVFESAREASQVAREAAEYYADQARENAFECAVEEAAEMAWMFPDSHGPNATGPDPREW